MSAFGAVVFDLYGTLVHEFPRKVFFEVVHAMAREIGADPEAFEREWSGTSIERQTGMHATVGENVRAIASRLRLMIGTEALDRALAHREAMYARHFLPRPGALKTLVGVKERGLPVALISMCAPDTPARWRATPLSQFVDVEVFSSEVGLRKPDPEIYRYASDRLGVAPSACLYVGDGAYGEMTGAAGVGMHPVLIRDPDEEPGSALRPEAEDWNGRAIEHLADVIPLLDAPALPRT